MLTDSPRRLRLPFGFRWLIPRRSRRSASRQSLELGPPLVVAAHRSASVWSEGNRGSLGYSTNGRLKPGVSIGWPEVEIQKVARANLCGRPDPIPASMQDGQSRVEWRGPVYRSGRV
jgi:hypothetical protein